MATVSRLQAQLEASLSSLADEQPNISVRGFLLLLTADVHGTVRDAALALGLSRPAVSRNVSSLEEAGLVTKHDVPGDKRSMVFKSTAAGRRLVDRVVHAKLAEGRARSVGRPSSQS